MSKKKPLGVVSQREIISTTAATTLLEISGDWPSFLVLINKEMRYPPPYESIHLKAFRHSKLKHKNTVRQSARIPALFQGLDGLRPKPYSHDNDIHSSLHNVPQTGRTAKDSFDPTVFSPTPAALQRIDKAVRRVSQPDHGIELSDQVNETL